jgi:hypothetical protein
VLVSVARQLRGLGFTEARRYVRECPDLAFVVEAIAEVKRAIREGAEVRNSPGLVRWLVDEELRARGRHEIHVGAGTTAEMRPAEHAGWFDEARVRRGA